MTVRQERSHFKTATYAITDELHECQTPRASTGTRRHWLLGELLKIGGAMFVWAAPSFAQPGPTTTAAIIEMTQDDSSAPVAASSDFAVRNAQAPVAETRPIGVSNSQLPDAPTPAEAATGNIANGTFFLTAGLSSARTDSSSAANDDGWYAASESSIGTSFGSAVRPSNRGTYVQLSDCPFDETRARECRMHWGPMIMESLLFNAFENAGNLYTGYWYRWETMHGKWWDRYIASAAQWHWDRWSDNNPALDDYVGHPIMGAITNSIWIQNDPKGMTLEFTNDQPYWRSRFRALAWSTFYSFAWKLGPLGEAGVGHNGDHYFFDQGTYTNETGWVELVTTPVGGLGWTVAEDYLDKHVVRSLEQKNRNPVLLTVYQFITPARGFANLLRFRPPWYRDSRIVKANSFWSDPGEGLSASTHEAMRYAKRNPDSGARALVKPSVPDNSPNGGDPGGGPSASRYTANDSNSESAVAVRPAVLGNSPNWRGPGGRHEIGTWWGVSIISGHIWGYSGDVKYMPVDLRYSYEFHRHNEAWTMRYSPEITAIAMLDWPTPHPTTNPYDETQRTRAYGSGVSPVGFQWNFGPLHRVQPFFSGNGGFIYFDKRVLSPLGSQWMYTIDYGAGINVFHHSNQAITIGYRYQHLSNANISQHNPGTDANTFYISVSRFRNKREWKGRTY